VTGLVLKKGKEKPILQRHHWIYSGAIQSLPPKECGPIVPVFSASGERLGLAALNPGRSIAAHMLSFGDALLEEALRQKIRQALQLRLRWFDPQETNAWRLINAEGDGIPGLIVDWYDNILVMQISHSGVESIRDLIQTLLIEEVKPAGIFEKSTSFLRKKEGMQEVELHRWGERRSDLIIRENGLQFRVDVEKGQKTGWFLDQREMRAQIRNLAASKRVLNVFSYTGGFSVAALSGGAASAVSVESSARCEALIEENLALNHLPLERHRFVGGDAFEFLKSEPLSYDIVILDPPAFVKKREDIASAFRAYKELNRNVIEKMSPGSLLLTCSCSYHVDETLFQNILFRAASEANRHVRIVGRHRQAIDHPVSLFHPESVYLKSLLLMIENRGGGI
jgi:23S rRNA (cytosine1962-C5)-methyltransferase